MARYIDADMLMEQVKAIHKAVNTREINGDYDTGFHSATSQILGLISSMPTADVEEVKHGRWLPQIVLGERAWDCSECKTLGSPHWKRCPICEAKMDGE